MKLKDYIFCDDIRREENRKLSLMGVYSDRIVFLHPKEKEVEWPIPHRLALLIRIERDKTEDIPDSFQFEYFFNNKKILDLNGNLITDKQNSSLININIMASNIPLEKGVIGFKIKLKLREEIVDSYDVPKAISVTEQSID